MPTKYFLYIINFQNSRIGFQLLLHGSIVEWFEGLLLLHGLIV
jgi:hypothetical protein